MVIAFQPKRSSMQLLGVSIGKTVQTWNLWQPLHVSTEGWKDYDQMSEFNERIEYLATRRNKAVEHGLGKYPETTDIMMVDSYFLDQERGLQRLIDDYLCLDRMAILAASIWGKTDVRLRDYFLGSRTEFYDKLAVPDARFIPYGWKPQTDFLAQWFKVPIRGLYRVCSVGGCYIFPRTIWDKGLRYRKMEDRSGCEHNYFCLNSGLPVFLDFNSELWRSKRYSLMKRVRVTAGAIRARYRN